MVKRRKDRLVYVRVKIFRHDDLGDDAHDLAIDENRTQQCHLGLEIVRGNAIGDGRMKCAHERAELLRRPCRARLVDFLWRASALKACSTEAIGITSIPDNVRSISRTFSLGTR